MLKNLLNITLIIILLIAFIGVPVTKSICKMEFCKKECKMSCCNKDGSCKQEIKYVQLDSDLSKTDAAVKVPEIFAIQTILLLSIYNPVAMLKNWHSEHIYDPPLTTIDIPVRVRCFRI